MRERAAMVLAAGLEDRLAHFRVHEERLAAAAEYVCDEIRRNYPDLRIPLHSRWRHFVVDGADRWQVIADRLPADRDERARIRIDLAVTSVLLDAGAGPAWRWHEPVTGRDLVRSEGLAIASLAAFERGLFSSDPARPLRADAKALTALTGDALAGAFQVRADNPLDGVSGRLALLKRLGEVIGRDQVTFGPDGRIGYLYDVIAVRARERGGEIGAPEVLHLLLTSLGPIWPGRIALDGIPLGDTWRHPAVAVAGSTHGLMPLHKLSQWLTYSLIEPLQESGLAVTDIDGLTGLAEYRNGGLFLDLGVLDPKRPEILKQAHLPSEELIVEWRALIVALLDRLAPLVRARLGSAGRPLTLGAILQGGTWSAGRRIARAKRPDGGPPLRIVSDGSVF